MARPKKNHEFDQNLENMLCKKMVEGEYVSAKSNQSVDEEDFKTYIALLNSERPEKEYSWMSDISLPEFATHIATQASLDVAQYFSTRDFVECYIEDEGDQALANAASSKELINRTLNQKHLHHYLKFVRGKLINNLKGSVYAECWWEQETREQVIGTEDMVEDLDFDVYGNPITEPEIQVPAQRISQQPVKGEVPIIDRFNYEILDPRNVVTDRKYTYSLQDKDYVYIRSEKTLEELKREKKRNGYFNLHLLEEVRNTGQTETERETKEPDKTPMENYTGQQHFDIYKRYGKYWAKVKETYDDGYPKKIAPGIDAFGKPDPKADFIEVVMTFARSGGSSWLIAFHPTPYLDSYGAPYRPVIRGLCYVHPTKDEGAGDGKYSRELQKGIDDTFNVSNDRTMLATLPVMKGKKYIVEDNPSVFIQPEHIMELENPREDLEELKIDDNIDAALNQIGLLSQKMDQSMAIFPTTMGDLPARASTTATAVVGAEGKTSNRTNYKSMTFEYTFLTDLYWMIQQMTYAFAFPQTGERLMGDRIFDFDPSRDYTYKPLSQSIETEQSKMAKVKILDQLLSRIMTVQHPDTVVAFNYIFGKICELLGDEFANFGEAFLGTDVPIIGKAGLAIQEQQGGGQEQMAMGGMPSNQYQLPMSPMEGGTRESAGR